jgi:hypothetical protein
VGAALTRREQVVLARIYRRRPTPDQIDRMLARLTAHERASVLEALAVVRFQEVPTRRRRRTTRNLRPR